MVYLQLFFAVAFPTLLGLCFVNIFLNEPEDASLTERTVLGFCAGLMLITLWMCFGLAKINVHFSVYSIALPLLPILIWGAFVTINNRLVRFRSSIFSDTLKNVRNMSLIEYLLVALIVSQILFVSISSLMKPVTGWDAWQLYSLRAKAFFIEGTTNVPAMPAISRGEFVALTQTWVFTCIGKWNEIMGKVNFPLFYISLLIIFNSAVRRNKSRLISLLSTSALATLPFLVYHSTLEYCDFSLALYYFIGFWLLFLWLSDFKLKYLLISLFFLLSAFTIKNESFFHVAMLALVLAFTLFSSKLENIRGIKAIRYAVIAFILLGGSLVLMTVLITGHHAFHLAASLDFSRVPRILQVFSDYLFIRNNFGILWPMLIVFALLNYDGLKRNFNTNLIGLVMLELFGLMAYYFVQSDIYDWLFYVTPAVRNILQFTPVVVFVMANLLTLDPPGSPAVKTAPKGKISRNK